MPELPEVETIKRDLEKVILNKKVIDITIYKSKVIKEPSLPKFKQLLKGATCIQVLRRGKLLILSFRREDGHRYYLTIHLRMTGQLVFGKKDLNSRLNLRLSDGSFLSYNDQRLLGELRLVKDWQGLDFVRHMGPEPLNKGFTLTEFKKRLDRKKAKIKSLLLDQSFIAGIGNIYAAETLFLSGINPKKAAHRLTNIETSRLFGNIKKVLRQAIIHRGTSFSNYRDGRGKKGSYLQRLFVYGRRGESCFKCGSKIKRISISGRGTYFCPRCQK